MREYDDLLSLVRDAVDRVSRARGIEPERRLIVVAGARYFTFGEDFVRIVVRSDDPKSVRWRKFSLTHEELEDQWSPLALIRARVDAALRELFPPPLPPFRIGTRSPKRLQPAIPRLRTLQYANGTSIEIFPKPSRILRRRNRT